MQDGPFLKTRAGELSGKQGFICCQCGGPRHPMSGKRCRECYRLNALAKKDESIMYSPLCDPGVAYPLAWMLEAERKGELFCTPDGFCFPEHISDQDAENFPWLAVMRKYAR